MNLATATATEHDKVTCSYENFAAEIENQVPDLDTIARLSADQVHQRLRDALLDLSINYFCAKNLIADAKRRMQAGETVGGCKTWESYVDKYVRKTDEILPTAIRRIYRWLDGAAIDKKHDGSKNRKTKQLKKQQATEQPVTAQPVPTVSQAAKQVQPQVAKNVTDAIPIADKLAREVMKLKLPKHVTHLAKQYLEARETE
jgi:hypothetical protein